MYRLVSLITLLSMSACKNDCQKLCDEMADYADECGLTWEREDVKSCRGDQANANVTKEQRDACATALPGLREEWTCEDLDAYFSENNDGDGGGSSDSGE